MTFDLLIRARRAVVDGALRPASIAVRDGRIAAVGAHDAPADAAEVVELAADEVLLPGLVDSHVHVNEPGRTEWEGFASATRAAAAGGVTTIIDMPLNSIPPTCDVAALEIKQKAARGRVHVDTGFWGGAIPGNAAELRPLHEAGVFGFKCFLLPSGVDEFPPLDEAGLERAMREIAAFDGLLIVHAEDAHEITGVPPGRDYQGFLRSRPPAAEQRAINTVLGLAGKTGARVHVLHLSSAAALPALTAARRRGIRVTAETCPHYLSFAAADIPDGATQFKCCPPIREAANREQLWSALADGTIDCVVSDHSPCTPDLKRLDTGDFGAAWGGIASLQLGLPAVWSQARSRGFGLAQVARWMAQRPATIAGLERKGAIEPGRDADFCVVAPEETFVVDPARLHHRNPITPYAGRELYGVVKETWLRGRP
ncbi:MAG TPA: allantoinase AllB, partial [Streptosporangiaceae bacterium]